MKDVYIRSKTNGEVHRTIDAAHWGDQYETLSHAEGKRLYREQETKALRKRLKPGATVYVKQNRTASAVRACTGD